MCETLLAEIEKLRNELYELYKNEQIINTELMLKKSNELDQLILKVQKEKKQLKNN